MGTSPDEQSKSGAEPVAKPTSAKPPLSAKAGVTPRSMTIYLSDGSVYPVSDPGTIAQIHGDVPPPPIPSPYLGPSLYPDAANPGPLALPYLEETYYPTDPTPHPDFDWREITDEAAVRKILGLS